ncbi:PD40 domain-containing protein [Pseudochryseolinea flava]|uniref:Translocation protein TolB n=1 Tax=Pseudochryseolinea flava TaxID=2059302 RepID=A0A364Y8Y6_9BACT|nr:PD40 domain-containing protein [Pseudochryseolinea flava]RAW03410.1 translocation protein TolB [Pseudochryseolinea flava]
MILRKVLLIIVLVVGTIYTSSAQLAREVFGKNRIQYRNFDWVYLSGENFDVYYYDGRRAVAQDALNFLEAEFDRITDMIDYPPYFKTKVFIYNSLTDLRQSNMGLNKNVHKVGGETDFIKPYIEAAHMGTAQEFKDELLSRMAELMVNEMMFGGNLKDIFQSSILMNLPDWFVQGSSLYVAKGWTAEMDDYIRQLMKTKRAKKATKLGGREGALVGQSIWNFITEKYGKSSMANILNYTRVTRNEERSILITLGITFKQMLAEWQRYYGEMSATVAKSYIEPEEANRFLEHHNRTTEFTQVKLSPDGKYLAYAENDRGRYVIRVRTLSSGKEKVILAGGSKVINQRVDYRQPLIAWSDPNVLGVIGTRQGQYVFWLYDIATNTKQPRTLDKFSNVRSFHFSNNGRLIIISADFEGRSDLFLLSTRRDRVKRLTNDLYDDLDPSFIPNSNKIVFSSNRTHDTLRANAKPEFDKLNNNYNLFVYDLDSSSVLLERVTNTISKDYAPLALDADNFYYLSDQRGIVNLFKFNRATKIYTQVTNFSSSIKNYDLIFANQTLATVMTNKQRQSIYVDQNFDINRSMFTPSTRRKELQQARVIREKRKQEENKVMSVRDLVNARKKEVQANDSTTLPADSLQAIPADTLKPDTTKSDTLIQQSDTTTVKATALAKKDETVNTDNYVFEDEAVKQTQPSESLLTRYMKARDKNRVTGPFPYEPRFSADNLVTSLVIDPLRDLGIQIEAQMNDMLENYRIYGGLMAPINLRGGDFFAEFQYLPKMMDFSVRFDRKAIRWDALPGNDINQFSKEYKYTLHRLELGASLPISDRFRLTVKPFAAVAGSSELGESNVASLPDPDKPITNYYAGGKFEMVYDNSVSTGLNLIEGSRGKISYQHHQGLNDNSLSFSQISADVRHYQKIYREIVLAVRGFAGHFFGNSPKVYLLGGMDNWLFNKSEYYGVTSNGVANPLGVAGETQDLLFVEYTTSLRGFDYSTLFGNSVLLFNAELRIPLIRALSNGPVSSNFFRNMQLTGFYDIGTSWSGRPPFNSGNSVSYYIVERGPFKAEIKNYLNPWLYSYGVGLRSMMLGYYVKFDLAWPVENYKVQDPRLHVTLGFDF